MHVYQDSAYQNVKGWKGAPVEDSLIKWRKRSAVVQYFLCSRCCAVLCAGVHVRCLQCHVLRPLAFLQRNKDLCCLLQSARFAFISHSSSRNIRETVHKSWDPRKSLPWLGWKRLVHCAFEWRGICFLPWHHMSKNVHLRPRKCPTILGWNSFRNNVGKGILHFFLLLISNLIV